MAQPAAVPLSARAAFLAARALALPSEVAAFEAMAPESEPVRAFLETPAWAEIRMRIVGDGKPPLGRPETVHDLSRLFRWLADGLFAVEPLTAEQRDAYLHCAVETEAFARGQAHRARVPRQSQPAVVVTADA